MNKSILIIEKNIENILFYRKILIGAGYKVHYISSDIQLLKYNFAIPDLFIINSRFLTLSAGEICQHLKGNAQLSNIPIVIISGVLELEALAMQCGATAFMGKPFVVEQFLALIQRCLGT
ncbi:response regulator [Chitinophaga agrisoli]|uniref:Response regulator n=1 Tax=Chitinophaga agrisoli TaxID=2607653 RepID=A0A5B2VNR3_9BACT|nr:response regulator [Chitinophaga agrisoli]KAA2240358.1 response regulator [Chitinophaga agrisoli]